MKKWDRSAAHKRVHFSCDGTVSLLRHISRENIRDGDTASGADLDDTNTYLWQCTLRPTGAEWQETGRWSQEGAKKCVDACDLLVVIGADGTSIPKEALN